MSLVSALQNGWTDLLMTPSCHLCQLYITGGQISWWHRHATCVSSTERVDRSLDDTLMSLVSALHNGWTDLLMTPSCHLCQLYRMGGQISWWHPHVTSDSSTGRVDRSLDDTLMSLVSALQNGWTDLLMTPSCHLCKLYITGGQISWYDTLMSLVSALQVEWTDLLVTPSCHLCQLYRLSGQISWWHPHITCVMQSILLCMSIFKSTSTNTFKSARTRYLSTIWDEVFVTRTYHIT